MAAKWFTLAAIVFAAIPIGATVAASDEDRQDEDRAVQLFMDGCVHFGAAPTERAYWLRNEAQLRPINIEKKAILWADVPQDSKIAVLNGDDGLCSVMLMDIDATSVGAQVLKGFEKAGLPLRRIPQQPQASLDTNDRYRTTVGGLPFDVFVRVIRPDGKGASPELRAILAFRPLDR